MATNIPPPKPLSYEGQVVVPYINRQNDPLTTNNSFSVPTLWINTTSNKAWLLVSKPMGVANWILISNGSAAVEKLKGNFGGAVSVDGSNTINVIGDDTTIQINGNPGTHTLTANVLLPPIYEVLVSSSSSINGIVPSATAGVPLISQGTSANPIFGTTVVAGGGTGSNTLVPYELITGGTTTTAPVQQVGLGLANQILTSNGPGFLPSFQSLVLPTESLAINTQVFSTVGTFTYTPTPGLAWAQVFCTGGGGAGGNQAQVTGTGSGAGGGGGGGTAVGILSIAQIGGSQTVIIGAGGIGGGGGSVSSFGNFLTGNGGAAGVSSGVGGGGGFGGLFAGTNVSFGIAGNGGSSGFGSIYTSGRDAMGGSGGGSYFGGGAPGNYTGDTGIANGQNANNWGGGGGGGANGGNGGVAQGGSGFQGIVVVIEYIGGFTTAFTWTDNSGTFTASPEVGYFLTAASTINLPSSPTEGVTIAFVCDTASAVTINAAAGQKIRIGNSVSSIAGSVTSTKQGDSLTLVYRTSDLVWFSISTSGNFTIA